MRDEQFSSELRKRIQNSTGVSLSTYDEQACLGFKTTTPVDDAPCIKGYYCELGDSFIQISFSGREEFTNGEPSAERFLGLIEEIVQALTYQGCVETQWISSGGKVRRSIIDLALRGRDAPYRLGKAPLFWIGLRPVIKQFAPLLARSPER
jgi:hypothetical protein